MDRVAIGIVDFAFGQRVADRFQFVAGGENTTRSFLATATSPMPSEAMRPNSAGLTIRPFASATAPCFKSSPASRTFCPFFWPAANVTCLPSAFAFLHHHGVAPGWYDAPGEDAHALAQCDRAGERLSGKTGSHLGEPYPP